MRIAVISDLHLEHRKDPSPLGTPAGMFSVFGSVSLPHHIEADVLVIAGDTHPDLSVRAEVLAKIENEFGVPVIHVNGNHDYYGSTFPDDTGEIITISGVRFAVATLWTHIDEVGMLSRSRFPDFANIRGIEAWKWNALNQNHIAFLEAAEADVIVTHHAPFLHSIEEEFQGDALNTFFVNNLDPERFSKTRLWIHGHVHTPLDYTVPAGEHEIRVVCNPLGYPQSRRRGRFAFKFVDVLT
jgi:DNA repair exonuclease SbcCD nuclease subunit